MVPLDPSIMRYARWFIGNGAIAFVATAIAALVFQGLGGGDIVVEGERVGDLSLGYIILVAPVFNAVVAGVTGIMIAQFIIRKSAFRSVAKALLAGYVAGTILGWIAQTPPFEAYDSVTEPLIYCAGPIGLLGAAVLTRIFQP